MTKTVSVKVLNDGKTYEMEMGSSLNELAAKCCPSGTILAAIVDHKLKELSFDLFYSHEVEFIGYDHADGRRTYLRSLCYLLQHATRTVLPDKLLVIDHSLPSGFYCEILERHHGIDQKSVV